MKKLHQVTRKLKGKSHDAPNTAPFYANPVNEEFYNPVPVAQHNQRFPFHGHDGVSRGSGRGERRDEEEGEEEVERGPRWRVEERSIDAQGYRREGEGRGGRRPMEDEPWFHEGVDREEVTELLGDEQVEQGTFLVRQSENAGALVLSVRDGDGVRHLRITVTGEGRASVKKTECSSVGALVDHLHSGADPTIMLSTPFTRRMRAWMREERPDPWEVDPATLILGENLGTGHFATVRRATWGANTQVAVKIISVDTVRDEEFRREVNSMKQLRHPSLVKLYGVVSRSAPLMILMEYVPQGSLNSFLGRTRLGVGQLMGVVARVAAGMAYLESQHVVHRDLAARNVLVGDDLSVKIADFGMARVVHEDIYKFTSPIKLPFRWTALEVFLRDEFSSKSDVWAFGVLVWEAFSRGALPYHDLRTKKEVFEFVQRGERLTRPPACPEDVWAVAETCWQEDPATRPGFHEITGLLKACRGAGAA